jgi:predicted GIY-YIG superfamily endonuclease
MYFVYLLSFDGNVFYVGMSKSISYRYRTHYQTSISTPFKYINEILNTQKKYMDITPIAYCDKYKAENIEIAMITYFAKKGNKLTNRMHNPSANRIITEWNRNHYNRHRRKKTKVYQSSKKAA